MNTLPQAFSLIAPLLMILGAAAPVAAQDVERSADHDYRVVIVADNLTHPWGLAFLPRGDLLVTERPGRLRRIRDGKLQAKPLDGVPTVHASRQGGLLDIALHPQFADNRLVYLSYAAQADGLGGTEVVRGRLEGDGLVDVERIFAVEPKTPGGAHYGARMVFDRAGKLYLTIGDRYNLLHRAQETNDHIGTIVRLNDDGSVPADNPFVDTPGAQPEIYSYGHRNPQGLTLRPSDGAVWAHEHGPRGGDEVNIIESGANYGWPAITYGIDYSGAKISEFTSKPGMRQPVTYWVPSIAPSGMAFYTGDQFPKWIGDLFVGALKHRHLRRLVLRGDKVVEQEELLGDLNERIRDVRSGPDGFIYVLTDSPQGQVLRLEPADE